MKKKRKTLTVHWTCGCGDPSCAQRNFIKVTKKYLKKGVTVPEMNGGFWDNQYVLHMDEARALLQGKSVKLYDTEISGESHRYRLHWNSTRSKAIIGCTVIPAAIVRKVAKHLNVRLK